MNNKYATGGPIEPRPDGQADRILIDTSCSYIVPRQLDSEEFLAETRRQAERWKTLLKKLAEDD